MDNLTLIVLAAHLVIAVKTCLIEILVDESATDGNVMP